MNCEIVREDTEEYLKNKLTEKEMNEIKKHLKECCECREYFLGCEKLINSYPDYEKVFPYPKKFEEKLKKSLIDLEKISVL